LTTLTSFAGISPNTSAVSTAQRHNEA
jgi:hypothetical protein